LVYFNEIIQVGGLFQDIAEIFMTFTQGANMQNIDNQLVVFLKLRFTQKYLLD
jgi:hypothetical protein